MKIKDGKCIKLDSITKIYNLNDSPVHALSDISLTL